LAADGIMVYWMMPSMPDPNEDNNSKKRADDDSTGSLSSDVPQGMTLENIIDLTGELEHLHELIMLHIDKAGGFTCTESYFSTVQPVLDLLELEIKIRNRHDMTLPELKLIIQDWIDKEIAYCKKR
jgi:hypothetical protein